ncbi:MAG: hypothetical protein K2P84_00060 [Undibacterium sp.]|nr:hypothetical protein [Undibacterium sp.]
MTILDGDIKILSSQVMDDVDEGGGRATGTVIIDGASNSIFPDVSELDRAYGRVGLRKCFVGVTTPNTDGYFGANIILADPPDDPKVSCTLFTTHDGFDRRSDAKLQLESYVVAGPIDNMIPYGQQIVGQRAVLAYQRIEHALPEVGQVFCLATEGGTILQQYFRIAEIKNEVQTFEDERGTFDRRVILITTSDALRYTFPGDEPQRLSIGNTPTNTTRTRIRKTSVVDLARYYGALALTQASSLGSFEVKVETIYTPLVPSATIETPVISATIQGATLVVPSGDVATVAPAQWLNGAAMIFGGCIAPRSLTLSSGATASTYNPKTDDGAGHIVNAAGAVLGTVDYQSGSIAPDLTVVGAWAGAHGVTYTYGSVQQQSSYTANVDISLGNRGSVYTKTLQPIPSPRTTFLDYMALGKWIRLRDVNGDGILKGDETAFGAGSINYVTGAIVVTLGALPDVGSQILFSWGSKVDTYVRTGNADMYSKLTVAKGNIDRASLVATILKDGIIKTLHDSGLGSLVGDGITGKVNYASGEIVIDGYRDFNTDIAISYSCGAVVGTAASTEKNFSSADLARDTQGKVQLLTHTLSAILPHTVTVDYHVVCHSSALKPPGSAAKFITLIDDGNGAMIKAVDNTVMGSIDYITGVIEFAAVRVEAINLPNYETVGNNFLGFTPSSALCDIPAYSSIKVKYQTVASMGTLAAETETFNPPLYFKAAHNEKLVAGGLVVTLASTRFVDRDAQLYSAIDLATGAGMLSGQVDYTSAEVTLTKWPLPAGGVIPTLLVKSCLTYVDGRGTDKASFRTTGAPIRPGSLYLQATALDGTLISGTSDADGNITGAEVTGKVRSATGATQVRFGNMVAAIGNETAWWYNAANVVAGQIFQPLLVAPETIVYNTVVTSTLPLDAGVLGIDPVRLPSDGRVPVIRAGDMSVIHHTTKTTAQTVVNGQVVNVGRTRLSRLRVFGADNQVIVSGFSADLDAGTVTFNAVAGYAQPVRIEHRIEDMSIVADAQINGSLRLSRQLTHHFPIGSFISSALIIGDLKARVPVLFDQGTWTGNAWSDALNGSQATATFNDALSPIVVTNAGAITERWVVLFTNTTAFQIIGEHVGVIATGNTSSNCAPLNPASGEAYFNLPAVSWGAGWAAGNILRFNTVGALFPFWISRTIQQGQATTQDDAFTLIVRGDVDRI